MKFYGLGYRNNDNCSQMEQELNDILAKIYTYCAYQDRCTAEVRQKLLELGLPEDRLPQVLAHLETERYLDDERYTRSFVRGKFHHKKWGRHKIRHALRAKQLPAPLVETVLQEEIEEDAYRQSLQRLLAQKTAQWQKLPPHSRREKIQRFLLQKGYEWEEIRQLMRD
ncbi:MAG: RecX family transcriptional regulator [Bacteroidetes bacterium]|nr:MAG: RecX family transcriptional regulator [Bacteroidota bacterium]